MKTFIKVVIKGMKNLLTGLVILAAIGATGFTLGWGGAWMAQQIVVNFWGG